MPDSLPLTTAKRTRERGQRNEVKGNFAPARKLAGVAATIGLGAPPRDVARLLGRHDASLPQYLDVQRHRSASAGQQRWPLLQGSTSGSAPTPEALACE